MFLTKCTTECHVYDHDLISAELIFFFIPTWDKSDYDLDVTMLQKPHVLGGHDMTPNTIVQTSAKVVMSSRFLGLMGSLPLVIG